MNEQDLLRILKQEEADASSYHDSELAKAQEDALKRYFAEPYGDEAENRSKVTTHDLEDTINWIMPDLMRAFMATEDLVSCAPQNQEDDDKYHAQQADGSSDSEREGKSKADIMAAYLGHVFFEDNPGQVNLHDWLFDGLLMRLGVMRVGWKDPEPGPPQEIEGVGVEQLARYSNDPEYEILAADNDGDQFMLEVRKTPKMGRCHVEAVPPEEFAIEKLAKDIETAKYHRRKQLVYKSEIAKEYPDLKERIADARSAWTDNRTDDDSRVSIRHANESGSVDVGAELEKGREQVWLLTEYLRIDFDVDGMVELREIKRLGDVILENIEVGKSEYVSWTPSRVSHKVVGRSLHDMLADLQKIRTVVTRSWLDGLSQTVTPRTYVNTQVVGEDGLDTILANEYGGVVACKGPIDKAVRETVTPDVSGPCLTALTYFDEKSSESSGVTKQAQGMDPQAMNKTATGIDLLQAAAKTRIEMIARWAAVSLEDVFKLILRNLVHHQDEARQVKLFGEWNEVDPRTWSDEMSIKIDVGGAGVSRQQRIANLSMIAGKQEQILAQAGPSNPLVTLQHYRATLTALTSDMGFPDPGQFFGQIPKGWQPPEPKQDPKAAEAASRLQLEQAKAQSKTQMDAMKLQHDQQAATIKAQSEREIAELRIVAEQDIARERMKMEMQLAREKAHLEADLKRELAELNPKAGISNGHDISSGVRSGGAIG